MSSTKKENQHLIDAGYEIDEENGIITVPPLDFKNMSFDKFYKLYKFEVDVFKQEKYLNRFVKENEECKKNKITKRVVLNAIKQRDEEKSREAKKNAEENRKKQIKKIFGNENITIPGGYEIKYGEDLNLYLVYNGKNGDIYICRLFTIDGLLFGKNSYLHIKFFNGKRKILSSNDFTDSKRIVKFFNDTGFEWIDQSKASLIVKYLSEFIRLNRDLIKEIYGAIEVGWNNEINDFLIPTKTKYEKDIVWVDEDVVKRFDKKGSLDAQMEMLRKIADKRIFSVVLFSLSAPLVKLLNIKMNYLFHIGGITGTGKSLAAKIGISMWGEPDIDKYGSNWNGTLNGLESYLERMKDIPAWVDEMESAKDTRIIIQLIYMYAEGRNKSRAFVKDGEILEREPKTFRGVMFSTGEKNIDEIINNTSNRNKPLGIDRRVISYESQELWKDAKEMQGYIADDVIDYHWGHVGIWWIEKLKELGNDKIKEFFEFEKKVNSFKGLDGKENIFYLMFVVLDILLNLKVINEVQYQKQKDLILEKVEEDIQEHQKMINIAENFVNDLKDFYLAKKNNFILSKADYAELKGEFFGVYESDRLWINKTIFDNFCQEKGYVKRQVLAELEKKGILLTDKNRKDKRFFTKDWGFGRPRFYCVNLPLHFDLLEKKDKEEIPF